MRQYGVRRDLVLGELLAGEVAALVQRQKAHRVVKDVQARCQIWQQQRS
jgi:hypothetical protein